MGVLELTPAQEAIVAWRNPAPHDIKEEVRETGTLPGLANLGNTCFANSVLQCLLNTPGWFPEACVAFSHFEDSTQSRKAALGRSFQNLALEYGSLSGGSLQKSNSALRNLKDAIAEIDPQYAGCQQQDAYEFLGCMLESLEEGFGALFRDLGPAAADGPKADVIRAICGVSVHTRRECHRCSTRFEVDRVTDTALRLPLLSPEAQFDPDLREKEEQTPVSLQELLDAVRKPETIEGYDCDECRRRSVDAGEEHIRSTITQHSGVISSTRDVVIIVLYRFAHALDASGNFKPTKVKRQVVFPTALEMESGSYNLFGVVSHLGTTLSAGHYVSAVRSRRDDMWYECNDETVSPLNVKALYDGRPVTAVREGAEPYILFYHRSHVASPVDVTMADDLMGSLATRVEESDAAMHAEDSHADCGGAGADKAVTRGQPDGDAEMDSAEPWVLVRGSSSTEVQVPVGGVGVGDGATMNLVTPSEYVTCDQEAGASECRSVRRRLAGPEDLASLDGSPCCNAPGCAAATARGEPSNISL